METYWLHLCCKCGNTWQDKNTAYVREQVKCKRCSAKAEQLTFNHPEFWKQDIKSLDPPTKKAVKKEKARARGAQSRSGAKQFSDPPASTYGHGVDDEAGGLKTAKKRPRS